ncbi:hypothetical protein [Bradyrhizobium sp. USDA 4502]
MTWPSAPPDLSDTIRCALVAPLCVMPARCGLRARPSRRRRSRSLSAAVNLNGALAGCRCAFSDQIAQAVGRALCAIKATDLVRPLLPFPELLDRENALRKALAEQVQTRTMSLLECNIQIQKLHSQLLEEERSRLSAAPTDGSKPPLAVTQWRQSNGET